MRNVYEIIREKNSNISYVIICLKKSLYEETFKDSCHPKINY